MIETGAGLFCSGGAVAEGHADAQLPQTPDHRSGPLQFGGQGDQGNLRFEPTDPFVQAFQAGAGQVFTGMGTAAGLRQKRTLQMGPQQPATASTVLLSACRSTARAWRSGAMPQVTRVGAIASTPSLHNSSSSSSSRGRSAALSSGKASPSPPLICRSTPRGLSQSPFQSSYPSVEPRRPSPRCGRSTPGRRGRRHKAGLRPQAGARQTNVGDPVHQHNTGRGSHGGRRWQSCPSALCRQCSPSCRCDGK